MSAHCGRCGADIVYPEGTWPLGTCARCDMEARAVAAESRLARLEEGLRWYAERRNYLPPAGTRSDGPAERWIFTQDAFDGEGPGARARSLLADQGGAARRVESGQ